MAKRFYWLKLKQTFFNDLRIKKLRKEQDGDTLVLVYIQLLLMSLETDGRLCFSGVESNICEEIALGLDRDVSMVQKLLQLLEKGGLLEWDGNDIILTQIPEMTGSETESAVRMRRLRCVKNETEASQCDENVRKCDENVTLEKEKREEIELEQSRVEPPSPTRDQADIPTDDAQTDFERLFDYTFEKYPKKTAPAVARQVWCRKISSVVRENRKAVAKLLFDGMMRYLDNYANCNSDDTQFRYLPKFSDWIEQYSDYWIRVAEKQQGDG